MFQSDHDAASHQLQPPPLILIAEDDPAQRLILKTVLEKEGYCLLEASNGSEALVLYQQHNPQMVFLDAVMPDMDGFEVCRNIRALEGGEKVLIMMITALNDEQSVKTSFEAGADDFITKPILWSVLTGRVRYLLKAKIIENHLKQSEEQYVHTQKLEVVGNLTEGISHHFNNLLTSIIGYTEMLLDGIAKDDEEKQTRYLLEVHRASKRASELIEQMQAFTDGGKSKPKVIMLNKLLVDVMGMLRPTLPSSIELQLSLQEDLPLVKIDPVQFQQLMMNLVLNARDAMEGTGNLNIELKRLALSHVKCDSCHQVINGDFLGLIISDTGTGIGEANITRVFEPYFTTRSIGQGSGMGLSVVHGIMHDHSGHIQVSSEPGKGTVFSLLFPVVESDEHVAVEAADGAESAAENGSNARILVVDDEESVGTFEVEYLKAHGHRVTYISDPADAIVAVTKNPEAFDLLITDKIMPHIDGLELAGAVNAVRPDLPVILCTGNVSLLPDINLACIGIRALLGKPMEGKELLATVQKVLAEV